MAAVLFLSRWIYRYASYSNFTPLPGLFRSHSARPLIRAMVWSRATAFRIAARSYRRRRHLFGFAGRRRPSQLPDHTILRWNIYACILFTWRRLVVADVVLITPLLTLYDRRCCNDMYECLSSFAAHPEFGHVILFTGGYLGQDG